MKGKKTVIFFLLAICICLFPARNAEAAVKYKNCFVKAQNGNLSYYNAKGKKAKGIVTVKGKNIISIPKEFSVQAGERSIRNIIFSDSIIPEQDTW